MVLPVVQGWLIDFRAARAVFAGRDNIVINALVGRCQDGSLKYCHCEDGDFRSDQTLRTHFVDDQDCRLRPNSEMMQRCTALAGSAYAKPLLRNDMVTIFLISAALTLQCGIISNSTSPAFSTVHDIGPALGLHVLTVSQFRAML
jgi:hypothetical protein